MQGIAAYLRDAGARRLDHDPGFGTLWHLDSGNSGPMLMVEVTNHSRGGGAVDIHVDGRPAAELDCERTLRARFVADVACLAQEPGSSFYRRLREKFGRLST